MEENTQKEKCPGKKNFSDQNKQKTVSVNPFGRDDGHDEADFITGDDIEHKAWIGEIYCCSGRFLGIMVGYEKVAHTFAETD